MKIKLNVYKYWSKPLGFHRFYRGLTKDTYTGWQFGLYLIGLEYYKPGGARCSESER